MSGLKAGSVTSLHPNLSFDIRVHVLSRNESELCVFCLEVIENITSRKCGRKAERREARPDTS